MTGGQQGQIKFAFNFMNEFRKCLIALVIRYVGHKEIYFVRPVK